jgi:hypothetical protein
MAGAKPARAGRTGSDEARAGAAPKRRPTGTGAAKPDNGRIVPSDRQRLADMEGMLAKLVTGELVAGGIAPAETAASASPRDALAKLAASEATSKARVEELEAAAAAQATASTAEKEQAAAAVAAEREQAATVAAAHAAALADQAAAHEAEAAQLRAAQAVTTKALSAASAQLAESQAVQTAQAAQAAETQTIQAAGLVAVKAQLGATEASLSGERAAHTATTARAEDAERVAAERAAALEQLEAALRKAELAAEKREAELEGELREAETIRRRLHNTVQELKGNIRVYCRVRPGAPGAVEGEEDVFALDGQKTLTISDPSGRANNAGERQVRGRHGSARPRWATHGPGSVPPHTASRRAGPRLRVQVRPRLRAGGWAGAGRRDCRPLYWQDTRLINTAP